MEFSTKLVVLIPTFDLLSIQEADGASLVISLAEEKDEGKYVCQISTYKPTEIKHTVKIRGKLRLIYGAIESNQSCILHAPKLNLEKVSNITNSTRSISLYIFSL